MLLFSFTVCGWDLVMYLNLNHIKPAQSSNCFTFEGVQQHLLSNVLIHLPLTCKAGVVGLQKHKHTPPVITVSGLSDECFSMRVCNSVCDHRCVWPVGIVEGEVLGSIFGLFGVWDAWKERRELSNTEFLTMWSTSVSLLVCFRPLSFRSEKEWRLLQQQIHAHSPGITWGWNKWVSTYFWTCSNLKVKSACDSKYVHH